MAGKRGPKRRPAGEMELLEMLWRDGPVTILGAQQALGRRIGYTTMQTRLNRLVEKGAVTRSAGRPAKYSAAVTSQEVGESELDTLVRRVSAGSVTPLVAHLLDAHSPSREELRELKQLVEAAERKAGKRKPTRKRQ